MPNPWFGVVLVICLGFAVLSLKPEPKMSGGQQDAREAAKALLAAADECFYDVRDRDLSWEGSPNCQGLGEFVDTYIALGGFGAAELTGAGRLPADIEWIGEQARSTAWMARATALSPGTPLSIW